MSNSTTGELDWNDVLDVDSQVFEPLPEGDYNFVVDHIERSRSKGGGELPPCNMAVVYFIVHGSDGRDVMVRENFILHDKVKWKISQLHIALGLKKEGEKCPMKWNAMPGKVGRCRVVQVPGFKDPTKMYNSIAEFYPKKSGTSFTPGHF